MEARIYLISGLWLGVFINMLQAQELPKRELTPNTQSNVHREYDEEGNLIAYDSVAIVTWGCNPDSAKDSLPDYWSYTPFIGDSVNIDREPRHFGFEFPGSSLNEWPQFNMDIEFYNPDSVFEGFDYSFSLTPGDSLLYFNDPYFDLNGRFPGFDSDIDQYIQNMQSMIDELIDRQEKILQQFREDEQNQRNNDNENIPDTLSSPKKHTHDGEFINI